MHMTREALCAIDAHMCEWCIHDLRWYVCIADAHMHTMHTLFRPLTFPMHTCVHYAQNISNTEWAHTYSDSDKLFLTFAHTQNEC